MKYNFRMKFQFLSGLTSFLSPVFTIEQQAIYVPIHRLFGLAGFLLATAAALLGLGERETITM